MANKVAVHTRINGEDVDFLCEPRQSLLEVLRLELGLTGAKECCNNGNCGACNVILDGVLVNSCLVLAVEAQDRTIVTIEGIAPVNGLHILQQKFLEHAALQCGVCTPGLLFPRRHYWTATRIPLRRKPGDGWPETCAAVRAMTKSSARSLMPRRASSPRPESLRGTYERT